MTRPELTAELMRLTGTKTPDDLMNYLQLDCPLFPDISVHLEDVGTSELARAFETLKAKEEQCG